MKYVNSKNLNIIFIYVNPRISLQNGIRGDLIYMGVLS